MRSAAAARIPSCRDARIALDAARPRRALPRARRADHRLHDSGRDLQQCRHPQSQSHRRGRGPLPDLADLCPGGRFGAGRQRRGALQRHDERHARDPLRRRDRRGLHPRAFRARSRRRATPADRLFLQSDNISPRATAPRPRYPTRSRRPPRRCRAHRTQRVVRARAAGGRAICSDQSGAELRAVPAARHIAHGPSRRHRNRRRICGRLRVLTAQPASLAAERPAAARSRRSLESWRRSSPSS